MMTRQLLIFLSCAALSANNISSWSFMDVDQGWNSKELTKIYFHHSEIQRQWAWELLGKVALTGDEKILDFGCGDGKITAELSRLLRDGQILGVDVSKKMIDWAAVHFSRDAFPHLGFYNTDLLDLSDFPGRQDYDVVCAFTVFHLVSNPLAVLKHLKAHLKPTGKLLITTPTGKNQALYQAANDVFPKYHLETPWGKNAGPHSSSMRTPEGCASMLKEAGYEVALLEIADSDNVFYDMDEFITWLTGTSTATWRIPLPIARAFYTDLASRMYELDPALMDEEGHVHFSMPRVHAIAVPSFKKIPVFQGAISPKQS